MDVEEQRARGIGGVARMHFPAGETPQQVAIDGAEQKLAFFGARPRAGDVIENPGDLGAGKIGVDDEAGFRRYRETGRGQASSDLRFDQIEPIQPS